MSKRTPSIAIIVEAYGEWGDSDREVVKRIKRANIAIDHDVAQAVAIEREAIAGWHESRADELRFVAARYFRLGQREAGKITEAKLHTHRISAIDIRNGEHTKAA